SRHPLTTTLLPPPRMLFCGGVTPAAPTAGSVRSRLCSCVPLLAAIKSPPPREIAEEEEAPPVSNTTWVVEPFADTRDVGWLAEMPLAVKDTVPPAEVATLTFFGALVVLAVCCVPSVMLIEDPEEFWSRMATFLPMAIVPEAVLWLLRLRVPPVA